MSPTIYLVHKFKFDLFSSAVTLQIKPRSPKSNQVFIMTQCYIHSNMIPNWFMRHLAHKRKCHAEHQHWQDPNQKQSITLPNGWGDINVTTSGIYQWLSWHKHMEISSINVDNYVPVDNCSVMSGHSLGWTSTMQGLKCLAQGHNIVPPVRLKTATPQSQVKHSAIEPLHSSILFTTHTRARKIHSSTHHDEYLMLQDEKKYLLFI